MATTDQQAQNRALRREQVERYLATDMTLKEWCGLNHVSESTMYRWMAVFRREEPDLFADPAKLEKERRLSAALDNINRRFGRGTVFHLAEGLKKPWAMRRELLTPCCTTRWDELPLVK